MTRFLCYIMELTRFMTVRKVPFQCSISLHTPEQGLTQERENEVDKTRWITQHPQRSKTLAPTD